LNALWVVTQQALPYAFYGTFIVLYVFCLPWRSLVDRLPRKAVAIHQSEAAYALGTQVSSDVSLIAGDLVDADEGRREHNGVYFLGINIHLLIEYRDQKRSDCLFISVKGTEPTDPPYFFIARDMPVSSDSAGVLRGTVIGMENIVVWANDKPFAFSALVLTETSLERSVIAPYAPPPD